MAQDEKKEKQQLISDGGKNKIECRKTWDRKKSAVKEKLMHILEKDRTNKSGKTDRRHVSIKQTIYREAVKKERNQLKRLKKRKILN